MGPGLSIDARSVALLSEHGARARDGNVYGQERGTVLHVPLAQLALPRTPDTYATKMPASGSETGPASGGGQSSEYSQAIG
jgi:hypothetical protein